MYEIDFSRYSLEELHQALASIDAEQYPENYAKLQAELAKPARQQQAQAVLREHESSSHDAKKVLGRTLLVITGICAFFVVFIAFSEGVIKSKSGGTLVTLAGNPLGFYFGIAVFVVAGICMMYMGFTGKGLKKEYQ